jgi:hypothetical protein
VRKNLVAPAIASAVTALVLIGFGIHPWAADGGSLYSLVCFSLAAFVLTANSAVFSVERHASRSHFPFAGSAKRRSHRPAP